MLSGMVLSVVCLWALWQLDPRTITASDQPDILASAADAIIDDWGPMDESGPIREIYIRDLDDPLNITPSTVAKLAPRRPELLIKPWSDRPADLTCRKVVCTDNFLNLKLESQPYGLLARVGFSTKSCGGEILLFRLGGVWRPLTKRMQCALVVYLDRVA